MKSRLFTLAVVAGGLVAGGAALRPVETTVWAVARAQERGVGAAAREAGPEAVLGVLGGFRAIVADVLWLRMHVIWEQRDLPATQTLIAAVSTVDPRPLYFWLNGARIVAYDMPVWRIEEAGGYAAVSEAGQRRIEEEQARMALGRIEGAMKFHPASAELWIERAGIEINKLRDPGAAAASFRRAWEQPRAPYFAPRLHAEMLRRAGREAEAYAWLRQLHPQLPQGDEGAGADVVLARIRELERTLKVPSAESYRPAERGR